MTPTLAALLEQATAAGLRVSLPDWLKLTDAQVERAARLVLDRKAECIAIREYPVAATVVLQLWHLDHHGEHLNGKLYVDRRGQVFGPEYTWREAERKPQLLVHRGCEIKSSFPPVPSLCGWDWASINYDGPPDRRCGWAATVAEARRQINQLEEKC